LLDCVPLASWLVRKRGDGREEGRKRNRCLWPIPRRRRLLVLGRRKHVVLRACLVALVVTMIVTTIVTMTDGEPQNRAP